MENEKKGHLRTILSLKLMIGYKILLLGVENEVFNELWKVKTLPSA